MASINGKDSASRFEIAFQLSKIDIESVPHLLLILHCYGETPERLARGLIWMSLLNSICLIGACSPVAMCIFTVWVSPNSLSDLATSSPLAFSNRPILALNFLEAVISPTLTSTCFCSHFLCSPYLTCYLIGRNFLPLPLSFFLSS